MSSQGLYNSILKSLHTGAYDDAQWPVTSCLIHKFFEAKGSVLVLGDGSPPEVNIFFTRICISGEHRKDLEVEYFKDYHGLDERLSRVRLLPDSQVTPLATLYTEKEKKTSVVFNEIMPRYHFKRGLDMRLDGPDDSRIVFSIGDPISEDNWSTAQM